MDQPEQIKKPGIGSTVGTIIIIALIILGGLYFWGKRLEESKNVIQNNTDLQNIPTQTAGQTTGTTTTN